MTAYGKDNAVLRNVPSFRQLSGQYGAGRRDRSPRGGPPYFVDQYKPPTVEPDTIALIAGSYEHIKIDESGDKPIPIPVNLPYLEFVDHFDGKTNKGAVCSAGPFRRYKDLRDPCNGCDIYFATLEPDENGKKKSTRMAKQSKFAFCIIDFGWYHKEPVLDVQTGQSRLNKKGEPYFNWVKCEGFGCESCKAKLEKKFGHNPHWPMPWMYFQTIREQDWEIGKSCRSCGGDKTVRSLAWTCRGCGEAVIDMADTNMKIDDIKKVTESHYTCGCGKTDFLKEIVECSECPNADRMTLFDVEFQVKRIPTGNNQSILSLSGWKKRRKLEGNLIELAKPKDLIRIFAPTPNKIQLERFGPPPLEHDPNGQDSQTQGPVGQSAQEYGSQYR